MAVHRPISEVALLTQVALVYFEMVYSELQIYGEMHSSVVLGEPPTF